MPSKVGAFALVIVAATALLLPVWYTGAVWETFTPFGTLIAWTTVSVAFFAVLTVLVSFVRHFVAPALEHPPRRPP